jgi:hypothetical protein
VAITCQAPQYGVPRRDACNNRLPKASAWKPCLCLMHVCTHAFMGSLADSLTDVSLFDFLPRCQLGHERRLHLPNPAHSARSISLSHADYFTSKQTWQNWTFLGPCHRSGKAGSFAVSCERVGRALWSLLGEGYGSSRGAWRMVSLADRNFFRHTRLLYGCMWRDCCVAQVGCTPLTEGVASLIIDGLRVFGLSAERRWEGDV